MRDYLVAAIVLSSLPLGLVRPYYGVLIYAWVSYMYPHLLAWSFVRDWPVGKIAGASALVGGVINHDGDFQPLRQRESLLMIVFMGCFTLSTLFAIYPGRAQPEWLNMAKIILMALFTATLLTSEKRLRAFFLVVAFSLGFYGVKGGLFGFRTGGEQMVWGPTPSIIGANNGLGVAFNMCLPIFWYLAKGEQRNWLKRLLQAMFFLTIPAIMFTYSRASALAMGAVILSIILKARRKTLGVVLVVCVTLIIAGYLPEKWINRQQSTLTYEEDSSAMSRLGQWQFCWRLALDRPLTGG
ncbi:MAG: putative O-glycosylation ligase, exosortase A system-associated, partial [Acidobacteria bacterium]|nr:putative O-glycosylation ligase, exosortase A system-associated [Acidobacteriota bacterium]